MTIRPIHEVDDHPRIVPVPGLNAETIKRDSIEPVPVGTYVVKVFRVVGYDRDCDGSLMARLENVDRDGKWSGWDPDSINLYPEYTLVVDHPHDLWQEAQA